MTAESREVFDRADGDQLSRQIPDRRTFERERHDWQTGRVSRRLAKAAGFFSRRPTIKIRLKVFPAIAARFLTPHASACPRRVGADRRRVRGEIFRRAQFTGASTVR